MSNRKPVRLNTRLAVENTVTAPSALFTADQIASSRQPVAAAARRVEDARGMGPLAFLELPYAYSPDYSTIFGTTFHDVLPRSRVVADALARDGGDLVHIGIGGSALGALTLINALAPQTLRGSGAVRAYVTDNVEIGRASYR